MQTYSFVIVYPEGETQEIGGELAINALVDVNGRPLSLPLLTNKMIAYRVIKIRTQEERGETIRYFFLDLVPAWELASLVG